MVSDGRLIRWATSAVVVAVAGFAAIVSYSHIYDLGRYHGQSGTAARLLPLSVDGLILAASLVMLHDARQGRPATGLARAMLGLGVAATLGANVAYGAAWGGLGAAISAWPAIAFVGSAEMLIALIRGAGATGVHQVAVPVRRGAPASKEEAARMAYQASVEGRNPLSVRALADRFDIPRSAAQRIRSEVAAGSNGQGPH